jgi:hypothetical protein
MFNRHCCQQLNLDISQNCGGKSWGKECHPLLYKASQASNKATFDDAMAELGRVSPGEPASMSLTHLIVLCVCE